MQVVGIKKTPNSVGLDAISFVMRKDEVNQWGDINILGVSIFGFEDLLQTAEYISKSNYFIGSEQP